MFDFINKLFRPRFKNLEERMLYYRGLTDFRLPKKSYVMVMLDGKNFSTKIKKKFKRPFDEIFIDLMNRTAGYVCSQVQGAKLAYVQSDEISIVITDFENDDCSPYYDFRICKMLSVIPSLATSYFNREIDKMLAQTPASSEDIKQMIDNEPMYQFDAKVWTVPSYNDVFAWFLYRQLDCVKNSKNQTAQTYLPHKRLLSKTADEQIELLKNEKGIDWYDDTFNDGQRYGRLVYKENVEKETIVKGETVKFIRSVWNAHYAPVLNTEKGKKAFDDLKIIPKKDAEV